MPITILPESTSRVLRSTQIITNPAFLIKELIDNAIDARANFIDVIISSDTLDKIEVRDNGHGIALDDLEFLGRHGHTSKLRNLEELRTVGRSSLGFRGEALASAVELGEVFITTRTEGEAVAVTIKLKPSGGIASQSSASHPIGTTVRVLNFLSKVPVRKEAALKGSRRTLSEIKEILQSYALARVNLRLSLKVLKNEKANWSFYSGPNNGIKDVVSQVIGRDTASQCIERISTPLNLNGDCRTQSCDAQPFQFVIQAFLPRPNADISKIGGGQYISVDSRPVSCSRGTFKKISSAFKSYIQAMATHSTSKVQNPFIRLNIICPDGSYDPNIEPAKDNVLFEDERALLVAINSLLKSVYANFSDPQSTGEQHSVNVNKRLKNAVVKSNIAIQKQDFISSFAPLNATTSVVAGRNRMDCSPPARDDKMRKDISDGSTILERLPQEGNGGMLCSHWPSESREDPDNEYPSSLSLSISRPIVARQYDYKIGEVSHLNPWVIAKLNTSTGMAGTITHFEGTKGGGKRPPSAPCLFSEPNPLSGSPHSSRLGGFSKQSVLALNGPQKFPDDLCNRGDVNGSRRTGRLQLNGSQLTQDFNGYILNLDRRNSKDIQGSIQEDTLCNTSATKILPTPMESRNPLVSPFTFRSVYQGRSGKLQRESPSIPSRRPQQTSSRTDVTDNKHSEGYLRGSSTSDAEDAIDFGRRKEEAIRRYHSGARNIGALANLEFSPFTTSSVSRSLPHQNRYKAAITALNARSDSPFWGNVNDQNRLTEASLTDGDQRSCDLPAKGNEEEDTLPKLKGAMLPLEAIPENAKLYNLAKVISVDISSLNKYVLLLVKYDQDSKSGPQMLRPSDLPEIEKTLRVLLKKWSQGIQ